jgi:hypothetical protein
MARHQIAPQWNWKRPPQIIRRRLITHESCPLAVKYAQTKPPPNDLGSRSINSEQWPGIKTLSKKFVMKQIPKRSESPSARHLKNYFRNVLDKLRRASCVGSRLMLPRRLPSSNLLNLLYHVGSGGPREKLLSPGNLKPSLKPKRSVNAVRIM